MAGKAINAHLLANEEAALCAAPFSAYVPSYLSPGCALALESGVGLVRSRKTLTVSSTTRGIAPMASKTRHSDQDINELLRNFPRA